MKIIRGFCNDIRGIYMAVKYVCILYVSSPIISLEDFHFNKFCASTEVYCSHI